MMNQAILSLVSSLQADKRLATFDEAATKQAIILRLLASLGWNPFDIDEVQPEYAVGQMRVDYALRHNKTNKVFIEVKKVAEELDKHQIQLLQYAFQQGIKLAVLTNGITWWFYLPLNEGRWEQRKFYTIEMYSQEPQEIASRFEEFLGRDNVITGKAVENAEHIYYSKQKQYVIRETLPRAWNKLVEETDELLVELVAEMTEKLCGHKPDQVAVEQFLRTFVPKATVREVPILPTQERKKTNLVAKLEPDMDVMDYSGRTIVAFKFQDVAYNVKAWIDVLIQISELMQKKHSQEFQRVLRLVGRRRPYFSDDPTKLRKPRLIDGSQIYVETNLSANSIVRLARQVLSTFGYRENDLVIISR